MGESEESLIKAINHYQNGLERYMQRQDETKMLHNLGRLYKLPIKVSHLEKTGVGRTVNSLRKLDGEVGDAAKSLVAKWKEMVMQEEKKTGGVSPPEEEIREDIPQCKEEKQSSSHKNENNDKKDRSDKRSEKSRNEKHHESKSRSRSENNLKENRHKEKHKKRSHSSSEDSNGDHDSKNYNSDSSQGNAKRINIDKNKDKKAGVENNRRSKESKHSSEDEESEPESYKSKITKHEKHESSDKKKAKHKSSHDKKEKNLKRTDDAQTKHEKKRDSSKYDKDKKKERREKDSEEKEEKERHEREEKEHKEREEKEYKEKEKHDKHKKSKHSEKTKSGKDNSSSSVNNSSPQSKSTSKKDKYVDKNKSSKSAPCTAVINGIGSESGTSFADALGMCGPPPSKKKKSQIEKPREPSPPPDDEEDFPCELPLPKEPLENLDINISTLLPPITPHYRPLGLPVDEQPRRILTDDEALSRVMMNKNQRTKVFSGNKVAWGKVPSLFDICVRILQDNIDALEYTGGVPYSILKPILEKATANQLYMMEHHNPYLLEDADELWKLHCQKEFRNKSRDELETWRDMYMRCLDEREAKLKALTANIKQSQDKSLPVRTTKLAYVDSVAKPPRNIARKQAKNDTTTPRPSPSSKLVSLATKGEAAKVAVPNPGARAAERSSAGSSHHSLKIKKAPLMAKTLSLFKNRFRR